jgi:hypothetical protein
MLAMAGFSSQPETMGSRDYSLNIVGESFRNPDGVRRQDEIRRCRPGERVSLQREPTNKHDPMATAVVSARGVQIGYLCREHARWIGGKIDKGEACRAIIERVHGGRADRPSFGVLIRVNYDGEDPDRPAKAEGWVARMLRTIGLAPR